MRVGLVPTAWSLVAVEQSSCVHVSGVLLSSVELFAGPGFSSLVLLQKTSGTYSVVSSWSLDCAGRSHALDTF